MTPGQQARVDGVARLLRGSGLGGALWSERRREVKPIRGFVAGGATLLVLAVLVLSASAWSSSSRAACADGQCRGLLKHGTYSTRMFTPKLTYTVGGDGWANYADDTVIFSLAPPGVSLAKAKSITDVILVLTTVQAPRMTCSPAADAKVPQTVRGMVRWLVHQKRLRTTTPQRVKIGGLKGYSLTVRAVRGRGLHCGGPASVPVIFPTNDPNGEFSLRASERAKLYLLTFETLPLAIIADSLGQHGPSLAADSRVISHFRFAKS